MIMMMMTNKHFCYNFYYKNLLNARIFLDAHKSSISIAFNAIKNFTFHSCSFNVMIPLATKLLMTQRT